MKINLFHRLDDDSIPSLFYRVLLCCYILFCFSSSLFTQQTYINISLCVVFLVYYTYRALKNVYQINFIFDIIFDVSFASIILYNYNQWDWFSGSFVYLMLLCIQNVDHHFTRVISFFIGISLILTVLFHEFSLNCLFPIILFCCFFWFGHFLLTLYQKRNALNNIIDNYFFNSTNYGKSYNIFRDSIRLFQERPFRIQINHIFCFRKKGDENGLHLVNGTKFLWAYKLLENNQDLNLLLKQTGFRHIRIELEGYDGRYHDCFIHRDNDISYLYVLILRPNTVLNKTVFTMFLFEQFFARMSKIIEFEHTIKKQRIKGLQEIKLKMSYVNMATTTMHFIRNKLSPLKNLIALIDEYSTSDASNKELIISYLEEQSKQVKKSMDLILSRANIMLEESDNPFVFSQTEKHGPQQLFSDIKLIWQSYGLDETKIDVCLSEKVKGQRKYISYNISGLNIVLDNWISNIFRYNNGFYEFNMLENDQFFVLEFVNNFKLAGKDNNSFLHIIKIYNENNKAEITKKNYHGLNEIRDYLAQMDIDSKLEYRDSKVFFTINLFKQTEIENEENPNN